MRTCDCDSRIHGPGGCTEPALVHPEDSDASMPCGDCAPFQATGFHSSNFPSTRALPPLTGDDLEAMAADTELVRDEFHGRAPGEIMEAYGK